MIELKKPSIRGTKDADKIEEMRRYLSSLVDDLQFGLQTLEKEIKEIKEQQKEAQS